jgi:S1-C subfamily serine protease
MLRWLLPVVVGAVAFVAGVTLDTRLVAQPEPAAPDGSQSVVDISAKVGPSVVSVRADQEIGSGMIYDANGFILTNAHVVSGTHNITVTLKDGRHFAGTEHLYELLCYGGLRWSYSHSPVITTKSIGRGAASSVRR